MNSYNIVKIKKSKEKINDTYIKSFIICETEILDWYTAVGFSRKYYKNCEANEDIMIVRDNVIDLWKNRNIPYTMLKIVKRG